jgi:hypothetical protein
MPAVEMIADVELLIECSWDGDASVLEEPNRVTMRGEKSPMRRLLACGSNGSTQHGKNCCVRSHQY